MAQVPATNDSSGKVTVLLDGNSGDVKAGGNGVAGDLSLFPKGVDTSIPATATISLDGGRGDVRIGGGFYQASGQLQGPPVIGVDGNLKVQDKNGNNTMFVDGASGGLLLGGGEDANAPLRFDTGAGHIRIGGGIAPPPQPGPGTTPQGTDGALSLQDKNHNEVIRLMANGASIRAGGNGQDGDLALFAQKTATLPVTPTDDPSRATIQLKGATAIIRAGGNGQDGDLLLFSSNASSTDIANNTNPTIHLDGQTGNITLSGDVVLTGAADCAEDFAIAPEQQSDPGTVMVIGEDGVLHASSRAYDKRVAGVIAGGGDYRSGIVLDRQALREGRQPVALVGKVYCKVDADLAQVEVGDLLTTSPTAGHAMKAADPARAFGAVIGKALQPLPQGRRLIPILVTLQ